MTTHSEEETPNVRTPERTSLYSGHLIDVAKNSEDDDILVQTHPMLFEAAAYALITAVLILFCFRPLSDPLLYKKSSDTPTFEFWVPLSLLVFVGALIGLLLFSFLQSITPRRFLIQNSSVQFSGVPGFSKRVSFDDIEAVYVFTAWEWKTGWTCHVAFGIVDEVPTRLLIVNWAEVCTRRELVRHRGEEGEEQWLIEIHKPLANLLGRLIEKPVKIQRIRGFFQRNLRWYWR